MSVTHETLSSEPEFDIFYFLELCGSKRIDQGLLAKLDPLWNAWKKRLNVHQLTPEGCRPGEGYLLAWLDKEVEDEVEELWQQNPLDGMTFHNLAIALVMLSAHAHIPELSSGACAPLPTPDRAMRKKFAKFGLEWNDDGTVNRNYAVFTPMPYVGSCEICHLKESCPKSYVRSA